MGQLKQELCTIRIVFPVTSDEQAIHVKKKIADSLKEIPEAQIQFSIMTSPPNNPNALPLS